jgi:ribosomal protein S18 acetylase RimI-like enzyme
MDFTIRAATADDYDQLCALADQGDALHRAHLPHLFRAPAGPAREKDYILGLLADEDVGLFVAEGDAGLLGFVKVIVRDTPPIPIKVPRRFAVVDNVAVREDARRAGVGRALMDRAHEWAQGKGATEIELNVYAFNASARAFYDSLGYETRSFRLSKPLG